jgi:hypothetical protein
VCRPGDGGIPYYRVRWGEERFVYTRKLAAADVTLGFLRGKCGTLKGNVLYTVERQGVPLMFVRER